MTPLLQLVLGDRIRPSMWAAVALCLTGVMVLTVSPGEAAVGLSSLAVSLGYGDWLCIGGAFSFAVYLIAMEKYANAGVPSVPLQAVKNVLLALMYLGWCTVDVLVNQLHSGMSAVASVVALWPGWNNPMLWAMTAVSAVVSGALADFWQARGQVRLCAAALSASGR
jgi:drug/metabolite transporter (DMT)-like permease